MEIATSQKCWVSLSWANNISSHTAEKNIEEEMVLAIFNCTYSYENEIKLEIKHLVCSKNFTVYDMVLNNGSLRSDLRHKIHCLS